MPLTKRIRDLDDFDDNADLTNKFLIVYDAATDSFKTIDADTLLNNALIDGSLPNDFIEEVTDSISYDGGEGF